MLRALVDAQVAELLAAERAAREHALDRLLDHALREAAVEDEARRALFDAALKPGVVVVHLVFTLPAGEDHLLRVDDDDVVAIVHMRGEGGLVLAAQAQRDDRGKAADHEAGGVDDHPFLLDLGRFGRVRLAVHEGVPGFQLTALDVHA